jgi:thiamine biosynthesis lipoprotein
MNTDVRVLTPDWAETSSLLLVERLFNQVERRFSRFLPDSELARLNKARGEIVPISDDMHHLLTACADLHRETEGVFDPAILPALEAAGYDRSFELLQFEQSASADPVHGKNHTFADIKLGPRDDPSFRAPVGLRLDLGGIGKGFAVDEALECLPDMALLIDAGGDVRARGDGPDGTGWLVSVASPFEDGEIDRVRIRNEAIATSTTARRQWIRDGLRSNHLIDPGTGESVKNDVISVSVVCRTAMEADVYAKSALIMGIDRGLRFLEERQIRGLFVTNEGKLVVTENWQGGIS